MTLRFVSKGIREINFLPPPQWGQTKTSISKALFISSAHVRHLLGRASSFEWGQVLGEFGGAATIELLHDAAGASTP